MNSGTITTGTVSRWFAEQGWGVLVSPDVDGTVFAHFSMIQDQVGYRSLEEGQKVSFTWAEGGQDGCEFRALEIYSTGVPGPPPVFQQESDPTAYSSSLTIDFGDGPQRVN